MQTYEANHTLLFAENLITETDFRARQLLADRTPIALPTPPRPTDRHDFLLLCPLPELMALPLPKPAPAPLHLY